MAKVSQSQRSAGAPQLKPAAVGNADLIVVTIKGVAFKSSQFRKEEQPVLTFEEYPEHEYRLNKRGTDRVCEKYGDETDEWIGETLPLLKAREEVGSQVHVVFQVPPLEEWKDLFRRAGKSKK